MVVWLALALLATSVVIGFIATTIFDAFVDGDELQVPRGQPESLAAESSPSEDGPR